MKRKIIACAVALALVFGSVSPAQAGGNGGDGGDHNNNNNGYFISSYILFTMVCVFILQWICIFCFRSQIIPGFRNPNIRDNNIMYRHQDVQLGTPGRRRPFADEFPPGSQLRILCDQLQENLDLRQTNEVLQATIAGNQATIAEHQATIAGNRATIATNQTLINRMAQEIADLTRIFELVNVYAIAAGHQNMADAEDLERLGGRIATLEAENRNQQEALNERAEDIAALEDENRNQQEALNERAGRIAALEDENRNQQEALNERAGRIAALQQENRNQQENIAARGRHIAALQQENIFMHRPIGEIWGEIDEIYENLIRMIAGGNYPNT